GGAAGNVAIGAINRSTDLRLQAGYKVTNPIATYGGDDGETVAEGERNIPLYLRHRDRLVTEEDFRNIVERTPGVSVGRVDVLSLYNPTSTPPEPAPGTVTLLVLPASDRVRPRWPIPDRLFLRTVCDYIDERRLITTEIYVRGPLYKAVYVTVGIQVREGYFRDVVRQAVDQRLHEYLSALPPGGPEESGWPRNRALLARELEAVVSRVTGVEYVNGLQMGVGDALEPLQDPYPLTGLELPWLAGLIVSEGEPEPLANLVQGSSGDTAAVNFKPVPVSRAKC
ncbi:MAG: baseplate J/gp47 family protein, partial [Caldilineaceae bacterium]|nr:baseplate J/gp47 family protein [Caldilineaceae bacterium]